MPTSRILLQLPEELVQNIIEYLDHANLARLNLVSRDCYQVAKPLVWRRVELVDCRTQHGDESDEHDDSPLIRKLVLLASRPDLAECVEVLTHRCHLPPPAIFNELPRTTFSSQTLSTDPRTIQLVKAAAKWMRNLQTLRIIFGHPNLNDALLRCLFDKQRQHNVPIRRLLLENCRISAGCQLSMDAAYGLDLPRDLEFKGLESLRFRRMPLRSESAEQQYHHVYSRGGRIAELQDGVGGLYRTTVNRLDVEQSARAREMSWQATDGEQLAALSPLVELFAPAFGFDDILYDEISRNLTPAELALIKQSPCLPEDRAILAYRGSDLDPLDFLERYKDRPNILARQYERLPSAQVAVSLIKDASSSLVSLTLDWVISTPPVALGGYSRNPQAHRRWADTYLDLFALRFPNLRTFQLRNAVVSDTLLPLGLYLLDHSQLQMRDKDLGEGTGNRSDLDAGRSSRLDLVCLEWMEAHPNLICLAWPMDQFFSHHPMKADIARRTAAVIENLGRRLVDLRVDGLYSNEGELHSENLESPNWRARDRRRRFIELFAAKMTSLRSIKVEGGIPRDERREVVRALHACPLEKIVNIGVSCPLGQSWGAGGSDLDERLGRNELAALEGEDKEAIWQLGLKVPQPAGANFTFKPSFGWPPGPPMAMILASHHAETVKELKFCGYKGSPSIWSPTPITTPMLSPLKYFHSLETLIVSMWLSTTFEDAPRDAEIISYWLNARSPTSTALVRITDEEPEGWERELRTKYAPDALAWRVTSFFGPFLSEEAKSRKGGMHVRASFCLGDWGGIFDLDVTVGKGALGTDVCLAFTGPREELEPERRRSKLENRRWF